MKALTNDEFIKKASSIHRKIDYSRCNYINRRTDIIIGCSKHGFFKTNPTSHLRSKNGCRYCNFDKNRKSSDEYIKEALSVHNGLYDYSKVCYKDNRTPIIIICSKHGDVKINPYRHLKGDICTKCNPNSKKTNKEYIKEVSEVHNNTYDYSKTLYKNARSPVIITCTKHGDFEQIARDHLNGHGCSKCGSSKGELLIIKWLGLNKIKYIHQKKFKECKYKRLLAFDFYLPDYNTCIEYDGEQHYKAIEYFGGECGFNDIKRNDCIKNDYCKVNNINIFRISYKDDIYFELNNKLLWNKNI